MEHAAESLVRPEIEQQAAWQAALSDRLGGNRSARRRRRHRRIGPGPRRPYRFWFHGHAVYRHRFGPRSVSPLGRPRSGRRPPQLGPSHPGFVVLIAPPLQLTPESSVLRRTLNATRPLASPALATLGSTHNRRSPLTDSCDPLEEPVIPSAAKDLRRQPRQAHASHSNSNIHLIKIQLSLYYCCRKLRPNVKPTQSRLFHFWTCCNSFIFSGLRTLKFDHSAIHSSQSTYSLFQKQGGYTP